MTEPMVSWLIPVYNAEKYFRRALDSVLAQTMQDFEVVIVMEYGCVDGTESLCDEYAAADSRVRVIKNSSRLGIAKSLNVGLAEARGKYIARMDADDYSYPERLEKQVAYMEEHTEVGILCTNRRVIGNGYMRISDQPTDPEVINARLLFGFPLNHPSMMLRARLFRENGWQYPTEGEAEDHRLCLLVNRHADITSLSNVLLDYYEHGDNAIFQKFDAVRKSSAEISRQALKERLGVDTSAYEDVYFGWREQDKVDIPAETYLSRGFELFRTIYEANRVRRVFREDVFLDEISRQWQLTLNAVGMLTDCEFSKLYVLDDPKAEISNMLARFSGFFSCKKKVAVWGTGDHSTKNLAGLDGNYPFDLRCFVDSNPQKSGTMFLDRPVISPEQLKTSDIDYVAIGAIRYKDEIMRTLKETLQFPEERILILPSQSLMRTMAVYFCNIKTAQKKQAYVFLSPDYGNLGDHAIMEGERAFLEDMGMCVHEFPADHFSDYAYITQFTSKSDGVIFITGGGFLGSLWQEHQKQALQIIKLHPNNPIVIFPQTLFWEDDADPALMQETAEVFSNHRSLLLCARDFVSYLLMKQLYPKCRVLLAPDMALYKDWSGMYEHADRRVGALLCLKEDKESILSETQKGFLAELCAKQAQSVSSCNTDSERAIDTSEREELLSEILHRFGAAKLIVTDRLHGMLFAAVTETPCVVLDNCNHKLRSTYEWLRDIPYIRFAHAFEQVEEKIDEVIQVTAPQFSFDRVYFKELEGYIRSVW